MPSDLLSDPEHWRERAEEIRVQAEQMKDPITRQQMFALVEGYERLARRAEERRAREGRFLLPQNSGIR
jgi:hypothetical protein